MNIRLQQHADGEWLTSYLQYKGRLLMIKARKKHGMKVHCILDGKVLWTLRYSFITSAELIRRAKKKIDDQIKYTERCIKEQ